MLQFRRQFLFVPFGVVFAQEAPAPAPAKPRFADAIDAFEAADRTAPPPKGGILFIGSSIFRQWTSVTADMAPLPVFNRAFGGSRTADILMHMDRVVLPYAPKVIVYYCGSNDINVPVPPETIAANFRTFVERVHAKLPKTRVLYVSINRAPEKRARWAQVDEANRLAAEYCRTDARLKFIDVNPVLFDAAGEPRVELYVKDQLHFKPVAYGEFTRVIRPVVEATWESVR